MFSPLIRAIITAAKANSPVRAPTEPTDSDQGTPAGDIPHLTDVAVTTVATEDTEGGLAAAAGRSVLMRTQMQSSADGVDTTDVIDTATEEVCLKLHL